MKWEVTVQMKRQAKARKGEKEGNGRETMILNKDTMETRVL